MYSEETPCKEKSLYDVVTSNVISDCAEIIRNELLNFKNPFPSWPPTQNELLTCNGSSPPYLEKLLLGIISSNTEKTERKLRIVSSIGQGLIYKATWGEKKTLKHVQLGVSIKRKTGSRKAIQWLKRFGHCLSYKEINHDETFLAEEQVNNDQRNFVPNNIQPGIMVTFIYHNCDHNLESIRGLTMHATNGIILRALHTSNEPQQSSSASTSKRLKNNSFKAILLGP